ncbi:uncharacterized protein GGS22DRAFT_20837 [Annulohypoxylon maeteangense]|uniref:uncharacterized protein n=1 Tax=Annulohypoxylon maeteangense TaxID=1927788 RepID=UPI0020078EA6|nr:uncharacterized protein GGS22DRAFT_20837 [Annulohypoxylon maeteangense]KAI0884227.1 hypothetical protein GGS22DRAFT_20837 [Annulohypoxylon maeteangense]
MISRQKSCVPCARAKRRCEPQTPKCPRCLQRGTHCFYKNQPVRSLDRRQDPLQLQSIAKDRAPGIDNRSGKPLLNGDSSNEYRTGGSGETIGNPSGRELSLLSSRQIRMPGLHPTCPFIMPVSLLNADSVPTLTHTVMSWPGKFLRKLEIPFIHSSQLDTPPLPLPLEEAFSACASYAAKREATKSLVMNIIERRVAQLIDLDPSNMSIEAHTASLQAFLILHLIQLWDGDVRQRTQAEMHSYILESWALQLHMRATEASKGQDIASAQTWDWWVMIESARRTAITTMLTQGIYEMARYGVCSYVPNLADMPFTANDGPWEAQNQSDWKEKIEGLDAAVTNYGDYAISCDEATCGPQSEFGKLLLLPCPSATQRATLLSGRRVSIPS